MTRSPSIIATRHALLMKALMYICTPIILLLVSVVVFIGSMLLAESPRFGYTPQNAITIGDAFPKLIEPYSSIADFLLGGTLIPGLLLFIPGIVAGSLTFYRRSHLQETSRHIATKTSKG